MDSKQAEALVDKYLKGETSLEEEQLLKEHFDSAEAASSPERLYFRYLTAKSAENPVPEQFEEEMIFLISGKEKKTGRHLRPMNVWYAAASLVFLLAFGILFRSQFSGKQQQIAVQTDTFEDPAIAFEETKRALLLISAKLNESSAYPAELSKFDAMQDVVKQP